MKRILFSLALVLASYLGFTQLSGNYTIGGTGANFTTIVQAVDTLNAKGVSGAVVFSIRQGTYTGQVKINTPTGVSSTNTVRFKPDTGNTAAVIATFSGSSTSNGSRGTWVFNGSDYITVDSITIRNTSTSAGHAVEFASSASYINIDGCNLENSTFIGSTSSNLSTVMDNTSSSNQASNITIENCKIKGGSYGVYIYGASSASQQTNWKIHNNEITDWYYAGIWSYYTNTSVIGNTVLDRVSGSYFYPYGVRMYYAYNSEFRKNVVTLRGSSMTYGYPVYMYYCRATSSARKYISNNMIQASKAYYGGYFYRCDYVDFVHNTIRTGTGYNSPYTCYYDNGTSNTVRNNIFYNSTGGYAFYRLSSATTRSHNNYYSSGTRTNFTLASTEKTLDPQFVSATDVHITNIALNNSGTNISAITTDIDGDTRTAQRDMGADEITPDTLDLRLVNLKSVYCIGSQTVQLNIQNYGLDTIKSAKIHWSVAKNSGTPVTQTPYSFSGSLASGQTSTWNLGTFTFNQDTVYQVWAYVDTVNSRLDMKRSNDSTQTDTFRTALNGRYKVGSCSNADFATPLAAVNALHAYGVCGAVTFELCSGTYNSQLVFRNVPGVSSTNTVTFTRHSTATTAPVVTSTTSSPTLSFAGGSEFVKFKNLNITNTSSGGAVAQFTNANNDIEFDSCYMRTDTNSTSFQCRVISNDFNNPLARLTVKNSTLIGGYASIYCRGNNTTSYDSSLTVTNCKLQQWYYYGMFLYYQANLNIVGNDVDNRDRRNKTTFGYGAYLYYAPAFKFNENRVNLENNSGYAVYVYRGNYNTSSSVRGQLINNMISQPLTNMNPNNSIYTLTMYYCDRTDIRYNNVLQNSGGSRAYAAYIYYGTGKNIQNNNFVTFGNTSTALYKYPNSTSYHTETYNNLYAPNGTTCNFTQGSNGINIDPEYFSPRNLHVQSISLNGTATPITGITQDYDGDTRNSTSPDIGADEFTPPANDLRPYGLYKPQYAGCGGDSTDFYLLVKNNGTNTQTTQPVTIIAISPIRDTITATGSKTIASNKIDTVYVGKMNTSVGGLFQFKLITSLTGDQRTGNDTMEVDDYRIYKSPRNPNFGTSPIVACANIDTILATGSNGKTAYWYDTPTGNPIHEGDTYNINLNQPDTFWVKASDDYKSRAGHLSNGVGVGNYLTQMTYGLNFDVVRELTIDTVTVYPRDSGTVWVRLLDNNGRKLRDTSFSVNTSGVAHLPIAFNVKPGKGYRLDANGTNTRGLYYTYSSVTYPYRDIDSSLFITSGQQGTNSNTRQYYYFYNWKISVEGCESDLVRVPVGVRPSINLNLGRDTGFCVGNTFSHTLVATNSSARSYLWQNGSSNSTYNVMGSGTYWCHVTSNNGCVSKDTIQVSQVPLPTVVFNGGHSCANQGPKQLFGSPAGGRVTGPGCINGLFSGQLAGVGSYQVTYTYTDSIGCSNSDTGVVVVDTAPRVSFTPPAAICQSNTPVQLSGGSPSGGYYFGKNVQGSKLNATQLGLDTIAYVFWDLRGCNDTVVGVIQVKSTPVINWGQLNDMCENEPAINLNASPSGGTYSGSGVSGSSFSPNVGAGSHTVRYSYTGSNGCTAREDRLVRVYPKPYMTFNALPATCDYNTNYGLTPFANPAGGTFKGAFVDPVTRTFDIQSAGAGSHQVTYVVANSFGCQDSASQYILVRPTPTANNFGGDKQICGPQTATLDALNPGAKYLWSRGDTTQTITVQKSGTYYVTITNGGCRGVDSVKVTYEEICVGIDEKLAAKTQVNLFPNPTSGSLNLEMGGFEGMDVTLLLHAVSGQEILRLERENMSAMHFETLDLAFVNDGVYVLRIETEEGALIYRITVNR